MGKERRQFPRYNVASYNKLKLIVDSNRTNDHLAMVGQGGCGFYCTDANEAFNVDTDGVTNFRKRVELKFEHDEVLKEPAEIQGTIVNAIQQKINDKEVFFYCVEFVVSHQDRMKPVIDELEKLAQKGELTYCD